MGQGANEDRSKEILNLEVRIKQLQILIAVVTLIGVLITTFNMWKLIDTDEKVKKTFKQVGETQAKIEATSKQIDDIKSLLDEKPFEGEWDYSSQYQRYYDERKPHELHGGGRAIIIWKKLQSRYDVNLSYSIKRSSSDATILTVVFHGVLMANESGEQSQQPFIMDNFRVLSRLHYQGKIQTLPAYQFKDCNYTKNNNRLDKIVCVLETPDSRSTVTFKWTASLH
ncbi:MAG: hypothetical protein H0U72_10400 [Nitrosospira sp.]|nr:hypothetical protein [Nitrosospira sp.]